MDQDSFRSLLSGSRSILHTTAGSGFEGSSLVNTSTKPKQTDAPKPAFKPRKVKKANEGKYRDRAAERRQGEGNDYAHVESVLEDFERRNAKNENKKAIDEQRQYLGGDGDHSILVKGLDMALLEQNKTRATLDSTEDDETLEKTYVEASTAPKKRTRADILDELKQKRSQLGQTHDQLESESTTQSKDDAKILMEEAKKQGKFKPIGFKPIEGSEKKKKKKKKIKSGDGTTENGEREKKKRKLEADTQVEAERLSSAPEMLPPTPTTSKATTEPEPEPQSLGEDFDIFAGAGEYEGIAFENDDDEGEGEAEMELPAERGDTSPGSAPTARSKGWFVTEGDEIEATGPTIQLPPPQDSYSHIHPASLGRRSQDDRDHGQTGELTDEREHQPMRLQPLSSSALPSIRDFLAMDQAAEAEEKRRKRKEQKKSGSGSGAGSKSAEEKANRDYQRLQSYTSKKEASGSR